MIPLVKKTFLWYTTFKISAGPRRRGPARVAHPLQGGLPMKLFKKHFTWFMERIDQDRLDSTAAHGAFFLLISFLPFVAFLLTLMQQIHFGDGVTLI